MPYVVKDDEVAMILRPASFDENGEWTGELETGLACGAMNKTDVETMSYLVHLATLMGTFLSMAQDDEGLYEAVADRRDYLVSLERQDKPLYEKVEGTDGKVLRLTRWTKTEGNA